jgi:hydrogenase nickel incorporation protein HypA/HybF
MHEVGIANAILEAGQTEAARRSGAKLMRIGVRVGVLSGVDRDALRFALTALKADTDLQEVEFEIQSCPRRNRCIDCGHEFESDLYSVPCPCCRSERLSLAGGEELDLAFIEVEESWP